MFSNERTLQDEGQKWGPEYTNTFSCLCFRIGENLARYTCTNVFAASSLIHIKTVENVKIGWTWNSAYLRAVTSVNFFHHSFQKPSFSLAHTKTEGFKIDAYSKDSTQVTVFETPCFHQRFGAFWYGWPSKTKQKGCVFKRKRSSIVGGSATMTILSSLGTRTKELNHLSSFSYCLSRMA